jgi:hypothetical protein
LQQVRGAGSGRRTDSHCQAGAGADCHPCVCSRTGTHTAAGFLYISTRNGYTPGAVPAGNGDGAFYLRKLAKKYDGDYTSRGEDTIWFAQVALMMGC